MDATYTRGRHDVRQDAGAAVAGGEIQQLADGRAAVYQGVNAAAAGDRTAWKTDGQHAVTKTASQVWIDGDRVWWDHSANAATNVMPFSDRDFYLGVAVGDAAAADAEGTVNLNVEPSFVIDLARDGGDVAVVLTAGTPFALTRGGAYEMGFSLTAEAQKLDWLSKRSFPLASRWVLDAVVEVVDTADADVADLSVGVANGTHASDADAIPESAFFHFDLGADLNIDAESDDGTTEVAATDTTDDFAVGTPVHLKLDGRDETNVRYLVNGVERLAATADLGNIAAAAGPLKALVHLEKSANDSPGRVRIHSLTVRLMQQSNAA